MYTVSVLVKNLDSESDELIFSNFRLKKIQQDDDDLFDKAKKLFPGGRPAKDDWIYERCYDDKISDRWNRIPNDIEEILFLLRLFKVGDIVFLNPRIQKQDGKPLCGLPYRVMSDIPASHEYNLHYKECSKFDHFASELRSQKNFYSPWFQTARRFFLYGSSKEFNIMIKPMEVDRIVDYMIVMESILVPENDGYTGSRLKERAVSLLDDHEIDHNSTKRLISDFYKLRSKIVHGDDVSSNYDILRKNIEFETIVRKVIIEAVRRLPEDDGNRKAFLKQLFDVGSHERANKVYNDFCAIKDTKEETRCFDLISKRLLKAGPFTENGKPSLNVLEMRHHRPA